MPPASSDIEDISINEALANLGVIKFECEYSTLKLTFDNGTFIFFDIHKSSVQSTIINLEEAVNDQLSKEDLGKLKFVLSSQYTKYLKQSTLSEGAEKQKEEAQQSQINSNVENREAEKVKTKKYRVFKYSKGIPLAEVILLEGDRVFLQIIDGKPVIQFSVDLTLKKNMILIPHDTSLISPILPFEYKDIAEVELYIKEAQTKSIDDMYYLSKSIWSKIIVVDPEALVLIASDSVVSFFIDTFATHFIFVVGPIGSGKGAILLGFKYMGYRIALASDMSGANILDLVGSVELGQIGLAEDELDDLDSDPQKRRIYKVSYDTSGIIPRTLDGNLSSRDSKYFIPFGFKISAAKQSLDEKSLSGFIDRNFKIQSYKGKPEFYVKWFTKQKLSPKYQAMLDEINYFRKLMLIYRLLHHDDKIYEVETNIDGRALELTEPTINLFSADSLSPTKKARKEILPVLSHFLREKGEISKNTWEAFTYKIIADYCDKDDKDSIAKHQPIPDAIIVANSTIIELYKPKSCPFVPKQ